MLMRPFFVTGRFMLGAFGAPTLKPLYGYSNDEMFLFRLFRPYVARAQRAAVAIVSRKRDANGQLRVTGNKHMKDSQHYPVEFGAALVAAAARKATVLPEPKRVQDTSLNCL